MAIEDKVKLLMGEQAFQIAILLNQIDEMKKRLEPESDIKTPGSRPTKMNGEQNVQHKPNNQ